MKTIPAFLAGAAFVLAAGAQQVDFGKDGRLYMIAGEKDNVCRLFSFDKEDGYLDWGVLGVDRSPYYAKIAYQVDAMCTGADGTVFIGESDRRAKLFMFVPGAEVMPGVLNPTNPR